METEIRCAHAIGDSEANLIRLSKRVSPENYNNDRTIILCKECFDKYMPSYIDRQLKEQDKSIGLFIKKIEMDKIKQGE